MRQKEEITLLLEENARLREENSKLLVQVNDLSKQVKDLSGQVERLRDQLAKDSHNSHLPPSAQRFRRQPKSLRKKSGKKPGGQPGHRGNTLMQVACPDTVIVHEVQTCVQCKLDLTQVPSLSVQRRQVLDLPIKGVVVVEHQAEEKCCPACHALTAAPFPQEVKARVQYSAALGAIGVYLVQQQVLPYERACELMLDLLGVSMSSGELAALVQRAAKELEPVEAEICGALAKGPVLHQDEKVCWVNKQHAYVHVSCCQTLTHYGGSSHRGKKALEEIGLLKNFTGTCVHDSWLSYFRYSHCKHGLCNVHLLRDLTFLGEEKNQVWAALMADLLLEMKQAVLQLQEVGQTQMREEEVADWRTRYRPLEARLSGSPGPALACQTSPQTTGEGPPGKELSQEIAGPKPADKGRPIAQPQSAGSAHQVRGGGPGFSLGFPCALLQ